MGLVHIMKRGGDDLYEYKKALKMAKKAIETLCEISEDMEEEYSERDDKEYDEMHERSRMRRYR